MATRQEAHARVGLPEPGGLLAVSRSEARENAILDAAIELLAEVGYDRLSMDALAERARASKATIYRHWTGKAEIAAAAVRRYKTAGEQPPTDTGALRTDLLALTDTMCQGCEQDQGLLTGVLHAMRNDPTLSELMHAQMVEAKRDLARQVINRAIERGELAEGVDTGPIDEVLISVLFMRWFVTGEPLDRAFSEHLVDDVVLPLLQLSAVPATKDAAAVEHRPSRSS